MLTSLVVCTYARADDLARLLGSLDGQSDPAFEVVVVDAECDAPDARAAVRAAVARFADAHGATRARLIAAPRGLTRQRNVGLRHARGDLVCFLDDDVTLPPTFVADLRAIFARPDAAAVGGVTGYDELHYPEPIPWRWRLRRALGTVPGLEPGAADRLGRHVPHGFAAPTGGAREVGWLAGFCMAYRREAIAGLWFDEALPTYGGEDRDFSLRVGDRWRLWLCPELRLRHHGAPGGRSSAARRVYESGFGIGRGFAKRGRGARDLPAVLHYAAAELAIDLAACVARPSRVAWRMAFARVRGVASGYRSRAVDGAVAGAPRPRVAR